MDDENEPTIPDDITQRARELAESVASINARLIRHPAKASDLAVQLQEAKEDYEELWDDYCTLKKALLSISDMNYHNERSGQMAVDIAAKAIAACE